MKVTSTKTNLMPNGEVLPPAKDKRGLLAMAKQLDAEIRHECALVQHSVTKLGSLLSKMRQLHLWKYVSDKNRKAGFRRFEDYVNSVLGSTMAHSKIYDLLAIHELTCGPNPIAPETIERIGRVKAVELARLAPEERTPDMLKCCLEETLPVVRRKVQAKLNMNLPADEQREATVLFAINLPESTRDELEELLEIGIWMEGIRDGDQTQSMRQKFFAVMVVATQQYYAIELADALQYKKARDCQQATAKSIEEDEYVPEPEEIGD
jgi:hypothetical protein